MRIEFIFLAVNFDLPLLICAHLKLLYAPNRELTTYF